MLTNGQWKAIEPYCLGKCGDPGQTGGDGRLFVEAVLWIARTGFPWRDLPDEFGHWNSVFKRFRRWCHGGWNHCSCASPRTGCKRGTQNQSIGKSRSGLTTKILALVDALGNLLRF